MIRQFNIKMLSVGTKFRISGPRGDYFAGNYEVRSIVDDAYVVVKSWAPKKKRYCYEIHHVSWFEVTHEMGRLTITKKGSSK